jgi:hypothetical protein
MGTLTTTPGPGTTVSLVCQPQPASDTAASHTYSNPQIIATAVDNLN